MKKENLLTPADYLARGLVSPTMLEQQMELMRTNVIQLEKEFPTATLQFDADNILRVSAATAEDAGEINYALNELSPPFTPYDVTVRQ